MIGKVVEPSDTDSDFSDFSTSSSSSKLNADFSSDDSIKGPIFQSFNDVSSDLEDDVQPRLNTFYYFTHTRTFFCINSALNLL